MSELVWIHRTNANELGISQTVDGTGRGSFFLVPVEARKIFFPERDFSVNPDISEQVQLHFIDQNETVTVSYSKPNSKTEHRLSLSGLTRFIGEDKQISPNKIICFYRKDNIIHFSTVKEDSIYGNLLNEFPTRGKTNNLVTETVFDNINKELNASTLPLPKPFLLLAGVSGTGKSRFVRQQAEKTGEFQLVAVRPDWHEPSDLLGYVSRLSGKAEYVMTDVLKFIVKAWQAVENAGLIANREVSGLHEQLADVPPFWLCLDEMNLAPVEQYFADYLAVLETRKWTWNEERFSYQTEALLSATAWEEIEGFKESLNISDALWDFFQQNGIGIPFNLIVAGTVNMDETTHAFSRKVLDRALSFDFSKFYPNDFTAFFEPKTQPKLLGYPIYSQATEDEYSAKSIAFLTALNEKLKETPFELAYRALNELLLSVVSFQPQDDRALQAVWDDFVMTKVLPRIEGDENKIGSVLDDLKAVLKNELGKIWDNPRPDLWRENVDGSELEIDCRCKPKLERMQKQLTERGMVSFW
ncbi:McrB family protein [Haemophilus sp. Marseille-Q0026]|uniref:McrB family protein n=1 Tax=Haemophilus sp. Marseille-Q0026 TaxID=2866580 RepID=UPI001CF8DDC5|nr:AAA family ATPase [Haemophilus sp. Marseille-Q0026]